MSPTGREPVRTCAGCRARGDKSALLRVVVGPEGEPRPDPSGRAPGRGAYVHPEAGCVEAAIRRGGLARALRTQARADGAARLMEAVRAGSSVTYGRSRRGESAREDQTSGSRSLEGR